LRVAVGIAEHRAGTDGQKRSLHGKLTVRVDATGHHHGGLVTIADQSAELDPGQYLAHRRIGQKALAQGLCVIQPMLQGGVFLLLKLRRPPQHQVTGATRGHFCQTLVG